MPWFANVLEPLSAVVAATLQDDSTLIEANEGFRRIIKVEGRNPIGAQSSRFFLQPNFTTLAGLIAGDSGEIYNGLLTMGDFMGAPRTLRGRVWRLGKRLRLLAEYDIDELERLNEKMIELNHEYATSQVSLAQTNFRLEQREAEIVALSLTDALTGLGNRRQLEQALTIEISRVQRTGGLLCAFMADLDHFKQINDTFGHEAGDKVLEAFGGLLREHTRATDIVARFGGEEFVGLMPHTELVRATATAERIREVLASGPIEPLPKPITASFGVVELARGEQAESLLRRVDKALYEAKHTGRNRVVAG